MIPKVYFSRTITPEKVLELYQMLGKALPGRVAIKLHSGEKGNQKVYLSQISTTTLLKRTEENF